MPHGGVGAKGSAGGPGRKGGVSGRAARAPCLAQPQAPASSRPGADQLLPLCRAGGEGQATLGSRYGEVSLQVGSGDGSGVLLAAAADEEAQRLCKLTTDGFLLDQVCSHSDSALRVQQGAIHWQQKVGSESLPLRAAMTCKQMVSKRRPSIIWTPMDDLVALAAASDYDHNRDGCRGAQSMVMGQDGDEDFDIGGIEQSSGSMSCFIRPSHQRVRT